MTKQEAIQQQIDEIMDTFEFDDVHKIMEATGWTWGSGEGFLPDIYKLRKEARQRMIDAARHGFSSTGGFTAILREDEEDGKPWVRIDLYFGLSTINDGTEYER